MRRLGWCIACGFVVGTAGVGCASLLSADPTPVPGAAATLTRSVRTPIPTPVRTPEASPSASAVPSRAAVNAAPSAVPNGASQSVNAQDVAQIQSRMEQAVASPNLPGIEGLLLDHVSLSTVEGGSVMDSAQTAAWLRAHAGSGMKVTGLQQDTQTLVLQVLTEGWPTKDPIQQGHMTFSFRRYDANGRLDDDLGQWKVDVIEAD